MNARSHRGMTCGNITCLEAKISKLEEKETLTEKERQSVSKMVKRLEALNLEFKTYHCAILDQIEEQQKLAEEQVILDEHEDKVKELMEHLEELIAMTEPVIPHAPGTGDY